VGAHVIRPIVDKMEIQYHLLEATYVHLYFTKGDLSTIKQESGAANGGQDQAGYGGAGAGGGGETLANGNQMPNVSTNAKRVYQTLKSSPQNNEGLHVQSIASISHMNVPDVLKACDELLSHSMIYTTVDDSTFALLDF